MFEINEKEKYELRQISSLYPIKDFDISKKTKNKKEKLVKALAAKETFKLLTSFNYISKLRTKKETITKNLVGKVYSEEFNNLEKRNIKYLEKRYNAIFGKKKFVNTNIGYY